MTCEDRSTGSGESHRDGTRRPPGEGNVRVAGHEEFVTPGLVVQGTADPLLVAAPSLNTPLELNSRTQGGCYAQSDDL